MSWPRLARPRDLVGSLVWRGDDRATNIFFLCPSGGLRSASESPCSACLTPYTQTCPVCLPVLLCLLYVELLFRLLRREIHLDTGSGDRGAERDRWRRRRQWRRLWWCSGRDRSGREQRGRSEWPGIPRGLGNEDEGTEAPIQAKEAEVARFTPTLQGPIAENHRELSAGDDDDRRLPGHWWGHPGTLHFECPRLAQLSLLNLAQSSKIQFPKFHRAGCALRSQAVGGMVCVRMLLHWRSAAGWARCIINSALVPKNQKADIRAQRFFGLPGLSLFLTIKNTRKIGLEVRGLCSWFP